MSSPHRNRLTLNQALLEQKNSLNFIRLILALLVIFAHSFPLTGQKSILEGLGSMSVDLFFIISGYLILASAERNNLFSYLWRRCLRIFPGYWVSILFVIVVAYPIGHLLGHAKDIGINNILVYFFDNFDMMKLHWSLGGPVDVPLPDAWNGSAWSLGFEFLCYLLLIPFVFVPFIEKRLRLFITISYIGMFFVPALFILLDINTSRYLQYARLFPMFLAGAMMYVWGYKILVNKIMTILGLAVIPVVFLYFSEINLSHYLSLIIAYIILSSGSVIPTNMGRKNDVSYGVYIYAFPLQQILVICGSAVLGILPNALLTSILSIGIGFLSWHLVEKPALSLKRLIPSKQFWIFKRPRINTDSSR